MKIAVNTRLLIRNKLEGIGWFSYEVLKRLVEAHPKDEFIFIFDRAYDSRFIFGENVTPVVIYPPARHPFLWYLWFQISIPYIVKKHKPDVFLSPDGYIPVNKNIKSISVIHDINFEPFPQFVPPLTSRYYRYFFPKFARQAKKIITVSHFSKSEIIKYYSISSSKISVAYNGLNEKFCVSKRALSDIQKQYAGGSPYFLFVGALSPRKNIDNLLNAFELFRLESKVAYKLVIVGEKMHLNKYMLKVYNQMQFKDDVLFLGRLDINELIDVYSAARAMVFIPYYEGFGIPLLEAMATHTPIIASEIPSLQEVAELAAIYVNPHDTKSVKNAMQLVAEDEAFRNRLIAEGLVRVKEFSWESTASKVWDVVKAVVKE